MQGGLIPKGGLICQIIRYTLAGVVWKNWATATGLEVAVTCWIAASVGKASPEYSTPATVASGLIAMTAIPNFSLKMDCRASTWKCSEL